MKSVKQYPTVPNHARKRYDNKRLGISEHALLRYFERVKGFDLKEIKCEILSDPVVALVDKLGPSGSFPNSNGYRVVIKNNVVVTIIPYK